MARGGRCRELWSAATGNWPSHPRCPGLRRLAAFAYVAERYGYGYGYGHGYGYRYGHGYRYVGPTPGTRPGRDSSHSLTRLPDAAARVARTTAGFPHARNGGALPGTRPGPGGPRPLPEAPTEVEARTEVEVAYARMAVHAADTCPARALLGCGGTPAVLLLLYVASGSGPQVALRVVT